MVNIITQAHKAEDITNWMVREGSNSTFSGNFNFSFRDINEKFDTQLPIDRALLSNIIVDIYEANSNAGRHKDILSWVDMLDGSEEHGGFSLYFFTDACPNYEEDDTIAWAI